MRAKLLAKVIYTAMTHADLGAGSMDLGPNTLIHVRTAGQEIQVAVLILGDAFSAQLCSRLIMAT